MFTGIIEEIGVIEKNVLKNDIHQYKISASINFLKDVINGDSISVNGVCLTAYDVNSNIFSVDISIETQRCTTFSYMSNNMLVNLERAVTPSTRLGGHFVSGHVDGLGELLKREDNENEVIMWISTPTNLKKYIATKGSICINGVSLTVNEIRDKQHCLTIIPHTLTNTTLSQLNVGDKVNIEIDLLARYIEQLSSN